MNARLIQRLTCMVLTYLVAGPVVALAAIPDKLPGDTLLYVGWPGSTALGKTFGETAMAKLMAEPQLQPLRNKLLPAIDAMVREQAGDEEAAIFANVKELVLGLYRYPAGLAVVRADAGEAMPRVDAGLIVEAGKDAAALAETIDETLTKSGVPMQAVREVKVGPWSMKQFDVMGPSVALRWGVIDQDLVVTIGDAVLRRLVPTFTPETQPATETADAGAGNTSKQSAGGTSLAQNPSFIKAMQTTKATPDSPILFVNLKNIIRSVETFQPMLAAFKVPVLGEAGGVQKVLTQLGLQKAESFTIAWIPQGEGLQSNVFFHCPGLEAKEKPLAEADLALIPKNASWASASNVDLLATYNGILSLISGISPEVNLQVMAIIDEAEKRLGMKLAEDVLGSFGDTWIVYDDPDNGSLLFTGLTLVIDAKNGAKLDEALRKLVEIISDETGSHGGIAVREEEYRGQKIAYTNFTGMPIPIAPAWTSVKGRMIIALFPQMVRVAVDRMLDNSPSILDNEEFRRGWKLMPANATSMNYIDASRGMRHMYAIGLPIAQALIAMGQKEGLGLDVTMLPALTVIKRHVFANVSAGANTADGYVAVSHGALPAILPAMGQSTTLTPLMVSILLPSLARSRELARRTASAANLAGIARGCLIYAEQNKGKLPPDLQTLVDGGILKERQLISPSDPDAGEEGSYIYIGAKLRNTMDPGLIVAYEKRQLHGGEGTNVAYLDGHVEWMSTLALDRALEENKDTLEKQSPGTKEEESEDKPKVEEDKSNSAKEMSEEEQEEQRPAPRMKRATTARRSPTSSGDAKVKLVRAVVSSSGPISSAIDTYHLEVGQYPKGLEDLVNKPDNEELAKKWHGPYVKGAAALKDPWGHAYKYLAPGEVNESGYDLWSIGPDGKSGTEDDIANFEKK